MQVITLTLEQVENVKRHRRTRYRAVEYTTFAFVFQGQWHFVEVNGLPFIREGNTLSMVLERPDDWGSLLGWWNQTNGEVAHPDWEGPALNVFYMLILGSVCVRKIAMGTQGGLSWLLGFALFCCAMWGLGSARQCLRRRRQMKAIRSLAIRPAS